MTPVASKRGVGTFEREGVDKFTVLDERAVSVLVDGVEERMADVALVTDRLTDLIDVFPLVAAEAAG